MARSDSKLVRRLVLIGVALVGAYLAFTPRPPDAGVSDAWMHAVASVVLVVVWWWNLDVAGPGRWWLAAWLAFVAGLVVESVQGYVPGREASLRDIGWNVAGVGLALGLGLACGSDESGAPDESL